MGTAVPVLSAAKRFASKADQAAYERERERLRAEADNKRRAKQEQLRAMEISVMMSETNRAHVERVLREFFATRGGDGVVAAGGREEEGSADDAGARATVVSALRAAGFAAPYCDAAVAAVGADETAALDWLCRHVPESELPAAFDPRGKQLDVVLPGSGFGSSQGHLQRLQSYGFSLADSQRALMDAGGDVVAALAALHAALLTRVGASPTLWRRHWDPTLPVDVECDALTPSPQDDAGFEAESLGSIYSESECSVMDVASGAEGAPAAVSAWRLVSVRQKGVSVKGSGYGGKSQSVDVSVDFLMPREYPAAVPSDAQYPNLPPLVFLACAGLPAAIRLSIIAALAQECVGKRGTPMVYELSMHVASELASLTKSGAVPGWSSLFDDATPSDTGLDTPVSSGASPVTVAGAGRGGGKADAGSSRSGGGSKSRFGERSSGPTPAAAAALERIRNHRSSLPEKSRRALDSMEASRAKLPAAGCRESILAALHSSQVVIVSGQTGCGKTTQTPQFILDDVASDPSHTHCKIVCTQPRRLAAIGVATRVADERVDELGKSVGYQIRGEKRVSDSTCLVFCTTGVLLRQLQSGLGDVTHIIVDEVHERSVDTDFLLAVLKRLLPSYPKVKLILMSATMESSLFAKYFAGMGATVVSASGGAGSGKGRGAGAGSASRQPCPVIEIPGRTFPVTELYLNDLVAAVPDLHIKLPKKRDMVVAEAEGAPEVDTDLLSKEELMRHPGFVSAMYRRDSVDYAAVVTAVCAVCSGALKVPDGAVLVFLPGVIEIRKVNRMLATAVEMGRLTVPVQILELHGSLTPEDQGRVFRTPPYGTRKVVLSTNVAETSITIDDVTVIIDTGRVKEMRFDVVNNTSRLLETWTSQDSSNQRRGRAGRVRAGVCLRMYPRDMFPMLSVHTLPEIQRTPLEQLCLQVKLLRLGGVRSFLAQAVEAPSVASVQCAVDRLCEIGALRVLGPSGGPPPTSGVGAAEEGCDLVLTSLGYYLSLLPMDVGLGKALLFGAMLCCLDPVLTVVASLCNRSPLRAPADKLDEARAIHASFAWGRSDHLAVVKVWERWAAARGMGDRRKLCKECFLSFETMQAIDDMRRELLSTLSDIGFIPNRRRGGAGGGGLSAVGLDAANVNSGDVTIIKSALCAGLSPSIIRVHLPQQKYMQAVSGSVEALPTSKEIKYYIRGGQADVQGSHYHNGVLETRVFLHPASYNFGEVVYPSPWMVYFEKVHTSKLYIRDSSPVTPYALLLFGGDVTVQHTAGTVTVGPGSWIRFRAAAKVGVLVKQLRRALDVLLAEKIEDPALDITDSPIVEVVLRLLLSSGH